LSNDQSRQRRFEIIKIIYGNLTLTGRPNTTFKKISETMQMPEHDVSTEIKVLADSDIVTTQFVLFMRIVSLTENAVQVMEKTPQPTNYDEFTEMMQNP